jgi:ABC-type transport system involved in cytochrome c biogenesis permease subunit
VTARTAVVLFLAAAALLAQGTDADRARLDLTEIRRLPVLSGTRFQAFESYAREVVLLVTGEAEPKRAKDGTPVRRGAETERKRGDPVLTYLEWWLMPEEARKVPWILIERPGTRKLLGFAEDRPEFKHVSFDELASSERFKSVIDSLRSRPRDSFTLDEAEVVDVNNRAAMFRQAGLMRRGDEERLPEELRFGPPVVPPVEAIERGVLYQWQPVTVLGAAFPGYAWPADRKAAIQNAFDELERAFAAGDAPAFGAAATGFRSAIQALGAPNYPGLESIDREVRYHRRHDFDRAAWFYLTSFILGMFALIWRNRIFYVVAAVPGIIGLACNAYGLSERTALSERALIGNLYETLLYLGAVAFALALVCEWFNRSRWFLTVGSLLATGFLWIAQDRALLMNPAISTLQPVLDNNFWIHIHVPTIVASYAPLMLAALMGNVYLLLTIFGGSRSSALKEVGRIQYWAMIPGVILLFAGLILGGIWADQSWGRFWGWDPKETWGFITWLVFIALIHGRWSGWLRDYGTAVGTIIGGASLVMTYWGVNFLLPGLHSYASANDGSAGLPWWERVPAWVLAYAGFEVALVGLAAFFRKPAASASDATADAPVAEIPREGKLKGAG